VLQQQLPMSERGKKRLALFGSTGSIGEQTLDVIQRLGGFEVVFLSAGRNWQRLAEQASIFHPECVALADENAYSSLKGTLARSEIRVLTGKDSLTEASRTLDFQLAVNGLVGVVGLEPSHNILQRGIDLALANKESLVLGGDLLNRIAADAGAAILPIDSEHGAIWQCLRGEECSQVKRLILTASGGPFREWPLDRIRNAAPEEALRHPTWKMGAKITIDSATLMNKGLEVIEAHHLFNMPPECITVRVHPASIVHSMVEFVDGSFKAQLGKPDMRLPIQYALTYPNHKPLEIHEDDPVHWPPLEFLPVDEEKFPCVGLAFEALRRGGTVPAALNGADEAAVGAFLEHRIRFGQIAEFIGDCLSRAPEEEADELETILKRDLWAREFVQEKMQNVERRMQNAQKL